jgi:flagellar motor switch protein FliN/FliY
MESDTASLILGIKEVQEEDSEDASPFLQVATTGQPNSNQTAQTHPYEDAGALELLLDIPMEICVELGRLKMMIKDVVELGTGSIVEIDKAAGEPVDLMVNGRLVARGEVVVIEDNFGVRITDILTPHERLVKLGEVA